MIRIHKGTGKYNKPYYWFTVHARNGEILVNSETYTRKGDAKRSAIVLAEILYNWNANGQEVIDDTHEKLASNTKH